MRSGGDFSRPDRPRRRFGLFGGRGSAKKAKKPSAGARPDRDTVKVIEAFIASRVGVEAFVEPPTATSALSVVLVAADGEWIRQRIPDAGWLQRVSKVARLPVYDASLVGYPKRMRDYRRPGPAESD
ncbi:MAG: oxidoreductase [Actinobacteria bacterium]|nr:oxidoreductase [Actinomycetota bacterium]